MANAEAGVHAPELPIELVEMIFSHLPIEEVLFAKNVCRNWRDIVLTSKIVRQRLLRLEQYVSAHHTDLLLGSRGVWPTRFDDGTLITTWRGGSEVSLYMKHSRVPLIVLRRTYLADLSARFDRCFMRWEDDESSCILNKDVKGEAHPEMDSPFYKFLYKSCIKRRKHLEEERRLAVKERTTEESVENVRDSAIDNYDDDDDDCNHYTNRMTRVVDPYTGIWDWVRVSKHHLPFH